MTRDDDTALIAGQLAELTHTVEEMARQLAALLSRADNQQMRADTQQEFRHGAVVAERASTFVACANGSAVGSQRYPRRSNTETQKPT